jgi:hypothetical protein
VLRPDLITVKVGHHCGLMRPVVSRPGRLFTHRRPALKVA